MHLLDIHSHILPALDDGAKDIKASIELLTMMKKQGITDVVATPHFDASVHNMDMYLSAVSTAREKLQNETAGLSLPNILVGSEVYYFKGIGKSEGIKALTFNNSRYILLELQNAPITDSVIKDINGLYYDLELKPIIAHIERYANEKGFKNLLALISDGICHAQVNALSVIEPPFKKTVNKLIKKNYITFIATDSHSPEHRPPLMDKALDEIKKTFGEEKAKSFIHNSDYLFKQITNG